MTSYDRHASHDSPYRTGQHVPLAGGRQAALTSIATSGVESRPDLTYFDDASLRSPTVLRDGYPASPGSVASASSPYLPGMRSVSAAGAATGPPKREANGDVRADGEIQLQNFHQGLPPPPPVSHSWKRIDRWAEDNYAELYDQLAEGATNNDLNELEHMLDCSLPLDVRDSLQIHDGQERGGLPTGIVFGCMLLDCEEIVQEWQQWRTVNREFLTDTVRTHAAPPVPPKPVAGSSASASTSAPPSTAHPLWRQELLAKQDSQPPNAVIKAYAHPRWIPLARDWGGNNLAVDLSPGPTGVWGQVIIFGRDFDCKYVVARSWAAFLAMVADDLGGDKWFVDDETQELKLREFPNTTTVEPGYLDILRWRTDQKYGRKMPRRRPAKPMSVKLHPHGHHHGKGGSPYGSPEATEFERGRSMQRFAGASTGSGSKARQAKSSPLAKVAEEAPAPVSLHPDMTSSREPDGTNSRAATRADRATRKLVEAPTPVQRFEGGAAAAADRSTSNLLEAPTPASKDDGDSESKASIDSAGESRSDSPVENGTPKGLGVDGLDDDLSRTTTEDSAKTVEL